MAPFASRGWLTTRDMRFNHVVVDGSNIATEGRSLPSLAQLDEAVQEFQREFPGVEIIVVVDASFGHRIEEPEREVFEEAEAAGDLVSPPAGAIGRGDAFLLRIAERTGATVLSNDSFQEFHGEHEWLFDEDRLIGGKPVPGVGWIFTPRTPVRGPKSRVAVRDAKRSLVRVGSKEASQPMPVPKVPPPVRSRAAAADGAGGSALAAATADADAGKEAEEADVATRRPRRRSSRKPAAVSEAIAEATQEVVEPDAPRPGRRRRRGAPPAQAINTPLAFITFIAEHPLGTVLEGEVESFTSHGAFVTIGETHAYVPLSGLGQPPPRRARDVLARGQRRPFLVQALDPPRRGIELALPEFAHVSGQPSEETVEAEIEGQAGHDPGTSGTAGAQDGAVGEDGPIGGGGLVGEGGAVGEGATRPPAPRRRTRRKAAVVGQPAGTADASPEDAGTEDAGTVPEQSHQARTRGGGPTAKLSTSTTDDPGSPTPPAPKRRPRKKAVTGDTPDVAAASGISTEAVGNEPTERQDSAGQDSAGQDSAGQDSAGQDSAGQDSA
ncbi:MAG: S1 RNA-binding domain-containing protein, partial [Actinomycetota bacterium]|nr:S1 RNA-binding domain-containing protein [Actinomycetota bacterium]